MSFFDNFVKLVQRTPLKLGIGVHITFETAHGKRLFDESLQKGYFMIDIVFAFSIKDVSDVMHLF